jgi:PLP dependent protein
MKNINTNVKAVLREVENVCKAIGRERDNVLVVAATKYATDTEIKEAILAGIKSIGENKVQDAKKKFMELEVGCDGSLRDRSEVRCSGVSGYLTGINKRFIGHLQTNKVKEAVRLFDCIESVDSVRLANAIDSECGKIGKMMPVLLEVNVGGEKEKYGFKTEDVDEAIEEISRLDHLEIRGFMTVLPVCDDEEYLRKLCKLMKTIFDKWSAFIPSINTLSMGMSGDFRIAIEEGSTEVRIGSAIFHE